MERVPKAFRRRCGTCKGLSEFVHTPNSEETKGHRFECGTCKAFSAVILFQKTIFCPRCGIMTGHNFEGYDPASKEYAYECTQCRFDPEREVQLKYVRGFVRENPTKYVRGFVRDEPYTDRDE